MFIQLLVQPGYLVRTYNVEKYKGLKLFIGDLFSLLLFSYHVIEYISSYYKFKCNEHNNLSQGLFLISDHNYFHR